MRSAEPGPGTGRIAALDVLRGVAILGTFASNAWLFAQPGGPAALLSGGGGFADDPVQAGLLVLSNGKFLALLTLLFGVGLEVQYRAAVRRGLPWPGRYPVRAAILFVEGLLHYLLVFEFDVLMGYAIASLVVAYLVGRSDRVVRVAMGVVGGIYVAVLLGLTALLAAFPGDPAGTAPAPPSTASWTAQVAERVANFPLYRVELVLIVPSAVVLFLAGSRLMRAGVFADSATGSRIRRRLMVLGLGVAAPLNVLTGFGGTAFVLVDRYLVAPAVAFGLLALITTVVLRGPGGAPRRGLTAVGRTALSCYVLQNLLAAVLCFDWGLGLARRLDGAWPWWVVGLWAGTSLLLVALSTLWLRRFDRGPLELVAHRLLPAPSRTTPRERQRP
ncbi:DUF418 domain-containing protein [Pseudonocardia humida]|uniref:DUF418 domain-containing protein n=1 Tax=Pseudonocardia humida TaxID=2800819 RepID=A0ABT1ABJ9_9PSEU|nr:DUF418 domain-containing protein [Pseudonocardia humida]MCO1660306.1 DUF418 domain-containing protein [Pseudonocardia humida]